MPRSNNTASQMSSIDDATTELERQHLLYSSRAATATTTTATTGEVTSLTVRCGGWIRNYTPIEPMLFVYTFCRVVVIYLTNFYFFDQASHQYGDPSTSSLHPCGNGNHSGPDEQRAKEVQKAAIQLDMLASFTGFLPAVIPTFFLGPATDSIGRRIGFVLPLLGSVARALVFLFVYATRASVYFMFIGTTLEGLGGGFGSFLMTSFSAAADVTSPGQQRALRICIIEAINVGASSLAGFVAGLWRTSSYEDPLMFCGALGVACLVCTMWAMPETRRSHPSTPGDGQGCGTEDSSGSGGRSSSQEVTSSGRRQQNGNSDDGFMPCSIQAHASDSDFFAKQDLSESGSSYNSVRRLAHSGRISSPPGSPRVTSPGSVRFHGQDHYVPQVSSTFIPGDSSCESFVCGGNSPRRRSRSGSGPAQQTPVPATDSSRPCCGIALANFGKSFKLYCRVDPERPARRSVLGLCFSAFLLTVAVNFSKPTLELVYRMGELCWNAVKDTRFESGWLVAHWVCILFVVRFVKPRLCIPDVYLAMIGCISGIAAPAVFAFATNDIMVNVSAACGTMARAVIPMLRSIASAMVDVDEQGALFAGYACVELAGAALFNLAFGQLYRVTVDLWTGVVFLVLAAIMMVVLLLFIILAVRLRRLDQHVDSTHTTYGSTD